MNQKGSTLQLVLIIFTLIIACAIFLYGWVYGSTLHAKLGAISRMPMITTTQEIELLRSENKLLAQKLTALEQVVYTLTSPQPDITTQVDKVIEIPVPDYVSLHDVIVDQKCFEDKDDLNQCVVLASVALSPTLTVNLKPQGEITQDGPWNIVYEFENAGAKITEFKTTTTKLFDAQKIATINYINNRDFSITTTIGASDKESTYAFDGSGWIDYQKFKY
ncbi:hypothetical protein IT409_01845 [Candidatus Falkowbacteria bacterium]|nr:hypothetical protein [Candidatus Falkowbacteria bacterium]